MNELAMSTMLTNSRLFAVVALVDNTHRSGHNVLGVVVTVLINVVKVSTR